MKVFKILLGCLFVITMASCATVKPYQKMWVNDSQMQLSSRNAEKMEMNFHNYREGAAGANGGKSGGGCGCN